MRGTTVKMNFYLFFITGLNMTIMHENMSS